MAARVDILPSNQRIRVELDGVTLAESTQSTFLYETGLPIRYYFPKSDVRMDLLVPTDHKTRCPYKGVARYWSVTVNGATYQNLAWAYDYPIPGAEGIAGLVAFYNEKTNIYIDGVPQEPSGIKL